MTDEAAASSKPACQRGCEGEPSWIQICGTTQALLCDRCRADLAIHRGIDVAHKALHRLMRHQAILVSALRGPEADVERCLRTSDSVHEMEEALKEQIREWLAIRPAKGPN